jgi:hypothetical protein
MFRCCLLLLLTVVIGCGPDGPKIAKARGKVSYKNAPLKFGSVVFQPENGKLASGKIQSDGTFVLGTHTSNDGAVVGKHRVRVVSLTSQDPNAKTNKDVEATTGKSLIPEKYTLLETTPIKEEVKDQDENVFELILVD